MTRDSKAQLFLELAEPNDKGFSRDVPITEFQGRYAGLKLGNGGSWCRDDSGLGAKFNINRIKQGNRIVAIALHGFRKQEIGKVIPRHVRTALQGKRCAVLGTSNPEIDHKDGRRDDPRYNDPESLTGDDFQPLSKAANNAKRQICKECRETNKRFDAKRLGYRVSQVQGNGVYRGSCVGCYWHDIAYFNSEVSKPRDK